MFNRYTLPMRSFLRMGLLMLLLCPGAGVGAATLDLPATTFSPPTGAGWYELLVDDSAALSFAEVRARAGEFVALSRRDANFGFTKAQVWAHFRLRHAPDLARPAFLLLPRALLDDVELYVVSGGRIEERARSGDARPFAARDLAYRVVAFELAARPGQTVDYYLRLRSPNSALDVTLDLVDQSDFHRLMMRDNLLLGGYFGVMVGLVVTALMLAMLLRQAVFAYFALYVGAFTLMAAAVSGYGMMLLWPNAPALQQVLPTVLVTLTMYAGLAFLRRFIDLSPWPAFARVFGAALGLATLGTLVHVAADTQLGMVIVIATALGVCPLVFAACLLRALRGDRFARYFVFGWLAYTAGCGIAAAEMYGVVAAGFLGTYGLYIGSLAKFVTLTLAMADRLRVAQREKEAEVVRTNAELAALNHNLESIVSERTSELEARNRELGELAIRDGLTGLHNHSAAIELLEQMLHQAHRYDFPVTVLMLDIDHFKRVNDTYGHQVGDALLEMVAQNLSEALRDSDVVGRYGGEEFLIAMPHADALAARDFGERLLERMRTIQVPGAPHDRLSASIGISVCHGGEQRMSAADLIGRADEALYRSKREGRDRLTLATLSLIAADGTPRQVNLPTTPA